MKYSEFKKTVESIDSALMPLSLAKKHLTAYRELIKVGDK